MSPARSSASAPDLAALRKRLQRAKVSQTMIATVAKVHRSTVSLVLAGHSKSERIIAIARDLAKNPDSVGRPLGRWGQRHREWLLQKMREEKHSSIVLLSWFFL